MGIFDIFKKKKTESTFPENELEQCLMRAASEISAQKEFYQKLLWNQLFVLTAGHDASEEGIQTLEKDTTVQFITFEEGQIPVFTSINRIFDKGVIKDEVPYMIIKGQDLFGVAKGATFILNPYSDYGKELIPEEIENLLNGTIYDKIDEQERENKKYQEFNEIFKKAGKRQEGLILLDGYHRKKLNESEKLKLEESIKDFKKCLDMIPDHWQSMILIAKALQRLERHSEALEQLEAALKIELENHSIAMEASLEAMHLKDLDKAIQYSEESLKRRPNDFALLGNHALNLLVAEKDQEAKETIDKAIKLQPRDSVNRNIESMIKDVLLGKRDRPTFEDVIK
ncbi:SseB family protein [Marinigracilibium pacificum]|uniref:Endopeptidase IV n=1 Tax=Marinigracilibium pacificum TaxID=2729599 RepID=A0A848J8K3_9BACT|nr:SseB family protein [Marinigracilibium pacificum]NMM50820.1 endopeptidase IV [Marinigracilibium pacificum]